jgi:hypothetical protein
VALSRFLKKRPAMAIIETELSRFVAIFVAEKIKKLHNILGIKSLIIITEEVIMAPI